MRKFLQLDGKTLAPLLQSCIVLKNFVCRIGGKLESKIFALANYLNEIEIPLSKFFSTHFLKQCLMGSLTGTASSKRVTEVHKGKFKLKKYQF